MDCGGWARRAADLPPLFESCHEWSGPYGCKEFSLFKDNISEEKQQNIIKLIETIRQNIQKNEFTVLKSQIEELKIAMKDMVTSKPLTDNNLNLDPKSTLNDL